MSNSEIIDETSAGTPSNCGWCKTTLTNTNHHAESVCKNCYGLLTRAGIKSSEIFGQIDPASAISTQG